MSGLDRLARFFVAVPATEPRESFAPPTPSVGGPAPSATQPASVAVLCAPRDAGVAGAVAGLALCHLHRSRVAVVQRWGVPPQEGEATHSGPGRRKAERLAARGLHVRTVGRLVHVDLAPDAAAAEPVPDDVPVVLVIAGARPAALDGALGACDRVLVVPPAGAVDGVADLALLDAARVARAVGLLELPAGGPARAIATAGTFLPPALRAAALDALGARRA